MVKLFVGLSRVVGQKDVADGMGRTVGSDDARMILSVRVIARV